MHRIRPVTRKPDSAAHLSPEVKITFLINVMEVALPLFQNKDPQNPAGTETDTDPEGEA